MTEEKDKYGELHDCPFCGAPPVVYEQRYTITCSNNLHCGVKPRATSNDLHVAIAKWEGRAKENEQATKDSNVPVMRSGDNLDEDKGWEEHADQ